MGGKNGGSGLTPVLLIVTVAQLVAQSLAQAPSSTDHCEGVNCQQGTCKPEFLLFTCKCNDGWENILDYPFLPCGIPKDCDIDYSCDNAGTSPSPPLPPFQLPNLTSFNPCTLNVCGFGKCVADENPGLGTVPYSCVCDPGNSNVLNMTSGTCLPNCNFGASCTNLGLPLGNTPPNPSPPPASTITTPPNEATPGQTAQPPNSGKRSKEVATLLASATVGAAVWLWM